MQIQAAQSAVDHLKHFAPWKIRVDKDNSYREQCVQLTSRMEHLQASMRDLDRRWEESQDRRNDFETLTQNSLSAEYG